MQTSKPWLFQKGNQYAKGHGRPKGKSSFRVFLLENTQEEWPAILEKWMNKLRATEQFSELMEAIRYLGPPTRFETEGAETSLPAWLESFQQLPVEAWVQIQEICKKYSPREPS